MISFLQQISKSTALNYAIGNLKNTFGEASDHFQPSAMWLSTFWPLVISFMIIHLQTLDSRFNTYSAMTKLKLFSYSSSLKWNLRNPLSIYLFQIQYLFCDKTGTLTENNMVFKRCTIGGADYGHNTFTTRWVLSKARLFHWKQINVFSKARLIHWKQINVLSKARSFQWKQINTFTTRWHIRFNLKFCRKLGRFNENKLTVSPPGDTFNSTQYFVES